MPKRLQGIIPDYQNDPGSFSCCLRGLYTLFDTVWSGHCCVCVDSPWMIFWGQHMWSFGTRHKPEEVNRKKRSMNNNNKNK